MSTWNYVGNKVIKYLHEDKKVTKFYRLYENSPEGPDRLYMMCELEKLILDLENLLKRLKYTCNLTGYSIDAMFWDYSYHISEVSYRVLTPEIIGQLISTFAEKSFFSIKIKTFNNPDRYYDIIIKVIDRSTPKIDLKLLEDKGIHIEYGFPT